MDTEFFSVADAVRVMQAIRMACKAGVEVREVAITLGEGGGMSCHLDTEKGVSETEIVDLSADRFNGGLRIMAHVGASRHFVGEWYVQKIDTDLLAAWVAVMANRTGAGAYWLDTVET